MIPLEPDSILTGVAPGGDDGLNVASTPPPATVHCVADGHATAAHEPWINEVTTGAALESGSNVITLP